MSGIDTSIYSNALRPVKSVQDYDNEYAVGQQNRLNLQAQQMKVDEYTRGIADSNQLRDVVKGFSDDTGANQRALLGAGRLTEANAYAKSVGEQKKLDLEATKSKLETGIKQFETMAQVMSGVRDQASYDMARQQAAQILGPEAAANIPSVYDPAQIEQGKLRAMSIKDQMANHWKDIEAKLAAEKFGEDKRSNRAREATAAGNLSVAQGNLGVSRSRLAFDKSQVEGTGPDASDAMIDAIGTGRMAPPSGYALRNPKILAMMERVGQKYPEYDATEYAAKSKAMRDFSSGTPGNSIRSFAVATDHLSQLKGLIGALENKDIPLINKYGNIIAQQTGSAAPTNFDAAKGIVAKEVLKSIVAGGGGVEERQELAHLMDNAKTTKQLNGVVDTYLHLMAAQKDGLEKQYELSTGRKDAKTRFNYGTKEGKPAAAAPARGAVDGGYRFKGGDPSKRENWEAQ